MTDTTDAVKLGAHQFEVVMRDLSDQDRHGMNAAAAGAFLTAIGGLYAVTAPKAKVVSLSNLHGELKPTSEIRLISARPGSLHFLFEAALSAQAALSGSLPTAIANFLTILDGLRRIHAWTATGLIAWHPPLESADKDELREVAHLVEMLASTAKSVRYISLTTAAGHTLVLRGVDFDRIADRAFDDDRLDQPPT